MEEKARKRREWIKNAAIVFLVVLLVLTFFSNTIMNYSLPEVSAQYSMGGNISSKVRGTATVEAVEPYKIIVEEKRLVEEVKIHTGDIIEKDQLLFVLGEGDETAIAEAEDALAAANLEYQQKILSMSTEESNKNLDVRFAKEDYEKALKVLKESKEKATDIKSAEKEIAKIQKKVDEYTDYVEEYTKELAELEKQEPEALKEQAVYDNAKTALELANEELKTAQEKLTRLKDIINRFGDEEGTDHDGISYSQFYSAKSSYSSAVSAVYTCEDKVSKAQLEFNAAERALNAAKKAGQSGIKADIDFTQELLDDANEVLIAQKAELDKENKALEALKKDYVEKPQAEENVKAAERAYLKMLPGNNGTVSNLELDTIKKKIERLEEKLGRLKDSSGTSEIRSKVAGVVSAVNYVAGETITPENPLAVIELTDRGYTASLTVTNEQSKLVQQGNVAEILNIWNDNVTATLTSIKNDPNSPGAKKILTFTITGEVSVGQTLELSAGERSAFYDVIVPNSAIREDNKGKFVLTVQVKNSPLGNRYIATRLDVEVLASDENASAVSGSTMGSEFIIKTSTKPIQDGMQVRLVEGGNAW